MVFLDDVHVVMFPEGLQEEFVDTIQDSHPQRQKFRCGIREEKVQNSVMWSSVSPKSQIPKFECGEVRGSQLNRASECWTPLGQEDSVGAHVRARLQDQECLLDKIPEVLDLQSTWTLLLRCVLPGPIS